MVKVLRKCNLIPRVSLFHVPGSEGNTEEPGNEVAQTLRRSDTAAKRTAHEQNTELPVSVVFPVCNQNLLRKQKIPVARSLKPKLKSYETNLRVKIVSLVS